MHLQHADDLNASLTESNIIPRTRTKRKLQLVPLWSCPIKGQEKMSTRTRLCIGASAFSSWKDSDIRLSFFCAFVYSICHSSPLLSTYALSFIFLIPLYWHLLLCRVLHGWGIEFTQIKQSLWSAVSWEMMHVEIEGISIQILHTHQLFYILFLTSLHHSLVRYIFPFFLLSFTTPEL